MEKNKQEKDIVYPSIIFKVKGNAYAINSKHVSSILQLPSYEALPEAPPHITGLFFYREKAIPMLDLRSVFGQPTLQQECDEFMTMLEARKQDHIHWVQELEDSVAEGREFTLATDPHQCKFGKWYDNYQSESHQVNFHLRKIDTPHKLLHNAAVEVIRCEKNCDKCSRTECLKVAMERAKNEYMPAVIKLLEEAKTIFESTVYHEMVLVINDVSTLGIVVDEVLSVETLEKVSTKTTALEQFQNTRYVSGIYKSSKIPNLILLLDDNKLQSFVHSLSF